MKSASHLTMDRSPVLSLSGNVSLFAIFNFFLTLFYFTNLLFLDLNPSAVPRSRTFEKEMSETLSYTSPLMVLQYVLFPAFLSWLLLYILHPLSPLYLLAITQ
jgi:hypothetical protein